MLCEWCGVRQAIGDGPCPYCGGEMCPQCRREMMCEKEIPASPPEMTTLDEWEEC